MMVPFELLGAAKHFSLEVHGTRKLRVCWKKREYHMNDAICMQVTDELVAWRC